MNRFGHYDIIACWSSRCSPWSCASNRRNSFVSNVHLRLSDLHICRFLLQILYKHHNHQLVLAPCSEGNKVGMMILSSLGAPGAAKAQTEITVDRKIHPPSELGMTKIHGVVHVHKKVAIANSSPMARGPDRR